MLLSLVFHKGEQQAESKTALACLTGEQGTRKVLLAQLWQLAVGNVSTWGRHMNGSALIFRAVSPCTWPESQTTLQTMGGTAFLMLADKKPPPAVGQRQARHKHAFEQWQKAGKQFIERSGVCAFSLPAFKSGSIVFLKAFCISAELGNPLLALKKTSTTFPRDW